MRLCRLFKLTTNNKLLLSVRAVKKVKVKARIKTIKIKIIKTRVRVKVRVSLEVGLEARDTHQTHQMPVVIATTVMELQLGTVWHL